MADSSHDAILQRHRARFEAHRQWLREQQAALADGGDLRASSRTTDHEGEGVGGEGLVSARRGVPTGGGSEALSRRTTPAGSPRGQAPGAVAAAAGGAQQGVSVSAPAYSEAQRSQRTAVAAAWVADMAHHQQRHPREREYSPNYNPHQQQEEYTVSKRDGRNNNSRAASNSARGTSTRPQQHQQYEGYGEGGSYHDHHEDEGEAYYDDEEGEIFDGEEEEEPVDRAQLMLLEGSPLHVYSRASQWARRREQKILEMREAAQQRELSMCTFRPAVRSSSNRAGMASTTSRIHSPNTSSSFASYPTQGALIAVRSTSAAAADNNSVNVSSVAEVSGWEEFMCRRLRAKQLEEEKKARLRSDGSKWTGAPTVIEAFNLGVPASATCTSTARKLQKVLKPPVVAPNSGLKAAVGAQLVLPPSSFSHHQRGAFSNKGSGAACGMNGAAAAARGGRNTTSPSADGVMGRGGKEGRDETTVKLDAFDEAAVESQSPIRATDVPESSSMRSQLPPRGLFSVRGSATFVESMVVNACPSSLSGFESSSFGGVTSEV